MRYISLFQPIQSISPFTTAKFFKFFKGFKPKNGVHCINLKSVHLSQIKGRGGGSGDRGPNLPPSHSLLLPPFSLLPSLGPFRFIKVKHCCVIPPIKFSAFSPCYNTYLLFLFHPFILPDTTTCPPHK